MADKQLATLAGAELWEAQPKIRSGDVISIRHDPAHERAEALSESHL